MIYYWFCRWNKSDARDTHEKCDSGCAWQDCFPIITAYDSNEIALWN